MISPRLARKAFYRATLIAVTALGLSACVSSGRPAANTEVLTESFIASNPMRWNHRAESSEWTVSAMQAVSRHDSQLTNLVPADIGLWCPGYKTATQIERRAFWVGLMSALAKYESRWRPEAAGGGGRYIGLLQISPATARQHGCKATSAEALKDGSRNLSCAVRIFSGKVAKDGVVAGSGRQGLGRDWGPMTKKGMRADMARWTSSQPYCQA